MRPIFYMMLYSFFLLGLNSQVKALNKEKEITLVMVTASQPRIVFGVKKLSAALVKAGYKVSMVENSRSTSKNSSIFIGKMDDAFVKEDLRTNKTIPLKKPGKEGFSIWLSGQQHTIIAGADDNGVLYGCLELADRITKSGNIPEQIAFTDQPEMVLRGACVGIQKSTYLPGRGVYEYPYTPETFPWLYDKAMWIKYLDQMAENRMNSLYLWNGHPFASLVKLKEYPYAVEVDDATFKKNEELYSFLTEEADKRGIWVIQMFYNIMVSKPFAEKNGLATQDRNRPIIPIIADYTRKSIAAFVKKYPNVGLLVTLGESMEGVGQDDIDWFTKTIIPGVKDGLKALGKTDEPPIVLRAHDTDAPAVMKAAKPLYANLYTMAKYNGEALTTYTPRGTWAELHRTLSRIGTVQVENVHILANLEPFRYGSADFIQKSVKAMHTVYGANALHIYPQASYWDWPYSADKTDPRLLQMDRDWIWYKEWSRYAWNCNRDRNEEINYWADLLAKKYGCDLESGKQILMAYEESGEIAPKLLRRYGITDGNRQTLTLGMFMTQLINPKRYGLFPLLYNSEGPEGEMLIEYADKEFKKQPHIGETPLQVAQEVVVHGQKSVAAMEKALTAVSANKEEFLRLKNDMYCYQALANFYAEKAKAAIWVLKYKYSLNTADLDQALPFLQRSVDAYKKLTDLTKDTYLYANSMQTKQRKIPIGGNDGKNKTWVEMLPLYQQELAHFKRNLDSLKLVSSKAGEQVPVVKKTVSTLKNAEIKLISGASGFYIIGEKQSVFSDTACFIKDYAPELKGLKGITFSRSSQIKNGTVFKFSNTGPVKVLVGFFDEKWAEYLRPSDLETDANANNKGEAEIKIANALVIPKFPTVNIHSFSFPAGTSNLVFKKGVFVILGIVNEQEKIPVYDAGLNEAGNTKEVDWLFE